MYICSYANNGTLHGTSCEIPLLYSKGRTRICFVSFRNCCKIIPFMDGFFRDKTVQLNNFLVIQDFGLMPNSAWTLP